MAVLAVGGVLLLVLAVRLAKSARRLGDARVVQVLALSITMSYSGLTSWQWATTRLHAPVWERGIVFAAFEVVMLAFAVASRENRLKNGRSGWQHTATLFFAGLMSLMALQVAGSPLVAAVRFGGGPLAALLLFHSLLGLELRHQGTERESLLRAALREARERIVSRLGIGRRGADSAAIARSRAADQAVRLATRRRWGKRAHDRLADAVDAAQHGLDPDAAAVAEAAVVARIVRRQSVMALRQITGGHVWSTTAVSGVSMVGAPAVEIAEPDTTEDSTAPAVPVISGWTGPRMSGQRRPGRRPRHLRPARAQLAPQTAPEQPEPAPAAPAPDTRPAPVPEPRKRLDTRTLVHALRVYDPSMSPDTIADKLGVNERTVRRHLPGPDVHLDHVNGSTN
jgi:hypothetical protein